MGKSIPLSLSKENGKTITVTSSEHRVGLIVWAKNGTPKLPLELTIGEAKGLRTLLDRAIPAPPPPMGGEPVAEVIDCDAHQDHRASIEALTYLPLGTKLYTSPMGGAAEGWVTVPKEPTVEMLTAGSHAVELHSHSPLGVWAAMLAAAPQEGSQP